jgi:hypothetical protein
MKNKRSKPNRQYPSNRKFKGFGYYLMSNDKLSKKNREEFLYKSSPILQKVYHSLPHSTETKMGMNIYSEMDSNLSDIELMDQWNHMYDNYGHLMDEFKEKWERERLPKKNKSKGKSKGGNHLKQIQELESKIQNLELRIRMLEIKTKGVITNTIGF